MPDVMDKRKDDVEILKKGVDVLIIGGGITGAGVFNMLSALGINAALIEANDFAFGTSSRSSKLIHGGLRYLANGQFSVVRDSVRERDFLIEKSGIVELKNFLIPLDEFSWSRSSLRFGLWIYSLFSRKIKARWYSREEINNKYPFLENTPQKGGYVYAEGVVDDSRLVIQNIMSGKAHGNIAMNYAELISLDFDVDGVKQARIRDKITGEEFDVKLRILVNSAGPWVGRVFQMMGKRYPDLDSLSSMLKLSKGDHIIVRRDLYPVDLALAIRSPLDKRQVFIIPRGDVVIIGTTETYYRGSLEKPLPSEEEIDYLIESVRRYVNIRKEDIINAYSGIRPLFGKGEDLGKISREYKIIKKDNIINVLGGKITTYRTVSKKISRIIMDSLGVKGNPEISFIYRRDPESVREELKRNYSLEDDEVKYAYDIIYENAFHLDDILWRREGYFIFSDDSGVNEIQGCIGAMKKVLGYGDDILNEEKRSYLNSIYFPMQSLKKN
ncbi:MAG: glycerol-3-phosphate dehydrogenase/oxidase [Thermoplasmata archaeon]